jgi:hypothetical protein
VAENPGDIMAGDEGPLTGVGAALAVCFGTGRRRQATSPLDFSACSRTDLLFRVFFACFPNQRIDRAARNSSRKRIFASSGRTVWAHRLLVRADAAMVFKQFAHADGNLLGGDDRVGAAGLEFLAAGNASDLFCVFSLFRECSARFFRVPIRWDAARSRVYCHVLRSRGMAAGMGRGKPAFASELVFVGVGMLPDLFRVGRGKNHGRRSGVAQLHGAG